LVLYHRVYDSHETCVFDKNYFSMPFLGVAQGATKYNSACLFIGDGDSRGIEKLASDKRITLLAHEVFSDGVSPWIIGIVIPK
jgi:hypothetical protein